MDQREEALWGSAYVAGLELDCKDADPGSTIY